MKFEKLISGIGFLEGPIALDDGSLIVVNVHEAQLLRVGTSGDVAILTQMKGGPNGAAIGPDGAVYVCNNGGVTITNAPDGSIAAVDIPADYTGGTIERFDIVTGSLTTLYTHCDGAPLRAPNDLVFDETGGFWFTDTGKITSRYIEQGAIYYARPDGSHIVRVRSEVLTPNGVGLSPDGSRLYVAETFTSRLFVHDLAAPGQMKHADPGRWVDNHVFGPLPGYELLDSLAVDAAGHVCVGSLIKGGLSVFSPAGEVEFVAAPEPFITNLCFGGGDMRDVWLTAGRSGTIYKGRWPRPGLRLAFNI